MTFHRTNNKIGVLDWCTLLSIPTKGKEFQDNTWNSDPMKTNQQNFSHMLSFKWRQNCVRTRPQGPQMNTPDEAVVSHEVLPQNCGVGLTPCSQRHHRPCHAWLPISLCVHVFTFPFKFTCSSDFSRVLTDFVLVDNCYSPVIYFTFRIY